MPTSLDSEPTDKWSIHCLRLAGIFATVYVTLSLSACNHLEPPEACVYDLILYSTQYIIYSENHMFTFPNSRRLLQVLAIKDRVYILRYVFFHHRVPSLACRVYLDLDRVTQYECKVDVLQPWGIVYLDCGFEVGLKCFVACASHYPVMCLSQWIGGYL